jgi:peptidyl-prolyl cis-trans isomerase B (cyclophilin B)
MTKTVDLETSQGTIRLELDDEKAPVTVKNFITNVENGHYDGTVFHRVIKGFMVQGGGFEPGMQQKAHRQRDPQRSVERPEERQVHGGDGTHLGSALGDRAVLHQRRRQRVPRLQVGNALGLGYAVFGKVVKGSEVIDAIEQVRTGNRAATATCRSTT